MNEPPRDYIEVASDIAKKAWKPVVLVVGFAFAIWITWDLIDTAIHR